MVDLHWRWSRFVDLDRSWRVIWLDWRSMVRLSRPVGLGWDRVTVERVVGFDWAVLVRSSMVRFVERSRVGVERFTRDHCH